MTRGGTRLLDAGVHVLGLAAFAYPFVTGASERAETTAHAGDAPVLFSLLGAVLVAVAISDVRAGRSDAKRVALLGVLAAVNAVLRMPGALGGASLMYVLPILAGATFGARFAFMLGATSFAASAVITGGVGPWLPFQMWGLGWVGAGAAVVRRAVGGRLLGRRVLVALAAYGWVAGIAFGALLNLWFWPFQQGASDVSWAPGLSVGETASRYWSFYALTSLAWDSARAIGNVVLILALGRPLLRALDRARVRMEVAWVASDEPAASR